MPTKYHGKEKLRTALAQPKTGTQLRSARYSSGRWRCTEVGPSKWSWESSTSKRRLAQCSVALTGAKGVHAEHLDWRGRCARCRMRVSWKE